MFDLKPKVKLEQKQNKVQEEKKIMTGKYMKGLHLYALDPKENRVYKVVIEEVKDYVFGGGVQATRKANINPEHPIKWCLNMKNAIRKFEKQYKIKVLWN